MACCYGCGEGVSCKVYKQCRAFVRKIFRSKQKAYDVIKTLSTWSFTVTITVPVLVSTRAEGRSISEEI